MPPLLPFAHALDIVLRETPPGDRFESVPAAVAGGRVLAKDVVLSGPDPAAPDAGGPVLRRGTLLNAPRVAALRAAGVERVDVWQPPYVSLLAVGGDTGGMRPSPEAGTDAGFLTGIEMDFLLAGRAGAGGCCSGATAIPADRDALRRLLLEEAVGDVIVAAGTGHGIVGEVVREFGEVLFEGVAVEPGGDGLLFAKLRQRTPRPQLFLGLPGTPLACLLMAHAFWVPMYRRMANLPASPPAPVRARLAATIPAKPGVHRFISVRLADGRAVPTQSFAEMDGWMQIPAGRAGVAEGSEVEVRLWG